MSVEFTSLMYYQKRKYTNRATRYQLGFPSDQTIPFMQDVLLSLFSQLQTAASLLKHNGAQSTNIQPEN